MLTFTQIRDRWRLPRLPAKAVWPTIAITSGSNER
jgi:hypothetical protein